jgi:hypothetical protein
MPPPRIMYVENKSTQPAGQSGVRGPTHIGRVTFSKTGKSLYDDGKTYRSLKGDGFKANYDDVESGEHYWISGPRRDGSDGLYGPSPASIDDDACEEYWMVMRKRPDRKNEKTT